jgi:hypothetical protein
MIVGENRFMETQVLEIAKELEARRSKLDLARAALNKLQRSKTAAGFEIDQLEQYIRRLSRSVHQLEQELKAAGYSDHEHPEQKPEKPLIITTNHPLPFEQLSAHDFERLCLWLVGREGFERAEHLGAAGSECGRDIIAWRGDELWAFQCKRVKRFGPQGALKEIEKVATLPEGQRPTNLVFVVTCNVTANTRQKARDRCAEQDLDCQFWASTELDERVKRYGDIVKEFFRAGQGSNTGEATTDLQKR